MVGFSPKKPQVLTPGWFHSQADGEPSN